MDGVSINLTEITMLASQMEGFRTRLGPAMKDVTSKGALNIKNAAKQSIMAQTRHLYVKQYPNSITYTITKANQQMVEAEIGPDRDKPQGALGNLLEYGTPNNGGPRPHLQPAMDGEADNYERFMAEAAENAVFE